MKKTLIAAAMLAGSTGVVYAQSNVEIYGLLDVGYVKESGSDARMGSNYESRIGFKGSEDLGNGMKATFQLEKRFNLNDGANGAAPNVDDRIATVFGGASGRNAPDWTGAANVGLTGKDWGAIRFGRVTNLAVESHLQVDPFGYYSVGATTTAYNPLYAEQLSNTARYDSPVWKGFSFGLAYTLGADEDSGTDIQYQYLSFAGSLRPYMKNRGNDGFNVHLQYDSGPLLLLANYQRVADSNDSYLWNLGGAYEFGPARVSLGYQDTRAKTFEGMGYSLNGANAGGDAYRQRDWILGLNWKLGAGELKASVNYSTVDGSVFIPSMGGLTPQNGIKLDDEDVLKYSLGYTYHLSRRTSLYGVVTYINSDSDAVGALYNTNGGSRSDMTGVQVGMTHRF